MDLTQNVIDDDTNVDDIGMFLTNLPYQFKCHEMLIKIDSVRTIKGNIRETQQI